MVDSPWLFQVDSDNEMTPESFAALWEQRHAFDFLLGGRDGRVSPWSRRVVSLVSRLVVTACYGSGVRDVNSPYRLLRVKKFRGLFEALPATTFAPNVILAGHACRAGLRIHEIAVPHRPRQTGEVSIKKWRLFKAAAKSFRQTIAFRFRHDPPA